MLRSSAPGKGKTGARDEEGASLSWGSTGGERGGCTPGFHPDLGAPRVRALILMFVQVTSAYGVPTVC